MRVPRGLHRQAARPGNKLTWRPGWRGTGMQPIRRPGPALYRTPITGLPLTGGQGQCNVYLGAQGVPITLLGTLLPGTGVLGLAVPSMSPGQYLISVWSGGKNGDVAAVNVIGTMDALTTS